MTHSVQNMSQATQTLEKWKRKNGQVNFKYPANIIFPDISSKEV